MVGKLRATTPALTHAPLQIRYLQQILVNAVSQGETYSFRVPLDQKAKLELNWWQENLNLLSGKPLTLNPPDMIISSDGAKTGGWGAACHQQGTGGPWSQQEATYHINEQELAAAKHAILTFTKIDNSSASYFVKMGGTHNHMKAI